jgi:hypothetical protein
MHNSHPEDAQIVAEYCEILKRLGLTDYAAAGCAGMSVHTIRLVRIGRVMPAHERCRQALRSFVELNRGAQTRAEVRLVA